MKPVSELKFLVKEERRITARILELLETVEVEKLFMPEFTSMFDFCRNALGFSDSETMSRLQAMRTGKKNPVIKKALQDQELSVSQINLLGRLDVGTEVINELVEDIKNKSVKASEEIIEQKLNLPPKPKKIIIETNEETYQSYLQIKSELKLKTNEEVLSFLMKSHRERNLPKLKKPEQKGRAPTSALRQFVLARAGHQCEYRHQHGRCPNKGNLQVDHVRPWAIGGTTSLDNLRILCQGHNLYRSKI